MTIIITIVTIITILNFSNPIYFLPHHRTPINLPTSKIYYPHFITLNFILNPIIIIIKAPTFNYQL